MKACDGGGRSTVVQRGEGDRRGTPQGACVQRLLLDSVHQQPLTVAVTGLVHAVW